MTSYQHTKIVRLIKEIDALPADGPERNSWVKAENHLRLLRRNATDDEVILFARSNETYILAIVAKECEIIPPDHDDLLRWSYDPYTSRVHYAWNKSEGKAELEPDFSSPGPRALERWQDLVFAREIPNVPGTTHYELLQEFSHAEGIHWREERHAYCAIDENGDWESVVSVTDRSSDDLTLITCRREALERFLAATNGVLVRLFDFTMIPNMRNFLSWSGGTTERVVDSDWIAYDQCLHPEGYGRVRGVQLVPVSSPVEHLFRAYPGSPCREDREYASFIIHDWRNGGVVEASTAPGETANYFNAQGNSLPFELSPAFFRPEVLLKYKGDREKFTVNEENLTISCRGAWYLRSYDVNEAGQVHAYLCDLRRLPYREQLYWKSHNEEPKGTISERSHETDFLNKQSSHTTPLERVLNMIRKWDKQKVDWWRIEDIGLLSRINTPVASSRDEWGTAFLELSKVVIEGFRKKPIQEILLRESVPFESRDGTLLLLEKLISSRTPEDEGPVRLDGLRQAQFVRTKVHSHRAGSEADGVAGDALQKHGTYRGHFEWVCSQIADDLEVVSDLLQMTRAVGGAE